MLKDSLARIQHWELGQFEKAEALHFEARDIRARQAGRSHPVYAASMLELGGYMRIGAGMTMRFGTLRKRKIFMKAGLENQTPITRKASLILG